MDRVPLGNLPTKLAVLQIDVENTCNFNTLENENLVNSWC
jgi:hypothetical protein